MAKHKKKSKSVWITVLVVVVFLFAGLLAMTQLWEPSDNFKNPTEPMYTIEQATSAPPASTEPTSSTVPQREFSQIISGMTLEEKVAQMMIVSCHNNVDIADASAYGVGGICFYAFSFEDKSADEVISMVEGYQNMAKIPMLMSTDEEGGTVNRVSLNPQLRAVPFWSPSDLYEYGGMGLVRSDTQEKADLLLSLGINVNLAPVCDVPLSEDNYIYDRCFSLDHDSTAEYVSEVVTIMKENKIGSVLKHFPGYGGSIDTHQFVSYDNRDYSAFENGDFKPFIAGIEQGADCVMVSHNIVTCMDSDMPASLSKPVHNILRDSLGFEGVIMTDDLSMQGITDFTDGENATVSAVLAGNDMLACEDYRGATSAIISAINDGKISESRIDESVERILKWKADLMLINQ